MKRLLFIPDSFKGSLSSRRVCEILTETAAEILPGYPCRSLPVADGGEGTVDAFLTAVGGERVSVPVSGPWGEPIEGFYGRISEQTAVVEMAAVAGLPQVGDRKNPEKTTTWGVGLLLRHAIEHGAQEVILGLGGSATNDGGCGAAAALGVRFFDEAGTNFVPTGETLARIARVDVSPARTLLQGKALRVMCDIDNPLCGPQGAAVVFGPQKGADAAMVKRLDAGLAHLAQIVEKTTGEPMLNLPGAGAAGGMGGGMAAMLKGQLQMGIETVLDVTGFESLLENAALVITGEGLLDSQSLRGKVVIGVSRKTKQANVPCVALVGGIGGDLTNAYREGLTAAFPICRRPVSLEEAMRQAEENLRFTARDVFRLYRASLPQ